MRIFRELAEPVHRDISELYGTGLQMLVDYLKMDRAVITQVTDLGLESLWWATAGGVQVDATLWDPARSFCAQVLDHQARTLVIRDAVKDPEHRGHAAVKELGLRSYIGVPLRNSERAIGVLSVQSSHPHPFTRNEVVLVNMAASLFAKAMEIEFLKFELVQTREALELAMAVVSDSAMESPESMLPNRRYLDIWLKANLFTARRRGEPMAVVLCQLAPNPAVRTLLRKVAELARGEDLLVDMGRDSFLILLPRSDQAGTEAFLDRAQGLLGPVPMGATLWHPAFKPDFQDSRLQHAMRRAAEALRRCREHGPDRQLKAAWEFAEVPVP